MNDKIEIVVADDNDEIRNYFVKVFSRSSDIKVVGEAKNGREATTLACEKKPNIVVMDIEMDNQYDGIHAIRDIKESMPDIKSIVLTIHHEDEYLFQAYMAGAMDYIIKTASVESILKSIRLVHQNKFNIRPEAAERILSELRWLQSERVSLLFTLNAVTKLTNSELEVIKAIYRGGTYSEIANERHVERGTIKTHVNRILKKFEVSRMSEVIRLFEDLNVYEKLDSPHD
ncbi:MAG: response regulator transcription factor [Fibrobacter sp.]|nr:response regulator transcription factor [Fibrobacter sp.]